MDTPNDNYEATLLLSPNERKNGWLASVRIWRLSVIGASSYASFRDWYYESADDTGVGVLSTRTRETLLALIAAFPGLPFQRQRYADFLTWRAHRLPRHKSMYEQLVRALDRMAAARGARSFIGASPRQRADVVARCTRGAKQRWKRWVIALIDRDARRIQTWILDPVTDLYAQTDAWIA